jgi:cellulose synthase/poly-beta-1,6-N-acetylglucosamine synthase-like glycosyltransferase
MELVTGADARPHGTARLVVAIVTYRRPDEARGAVLAVTDHLSELRRLRPEIRFEILVVDNDPLGGAESAVAEASLASGGAIPVHYRCEPAPGISAARNRALDEAGDADLLVFIDDDERPRAGWLRLLLETRERFHADLVYGRVPGEFSTPPDPWLIAGRFFERPHHTTGAVLPAAAAGNLLLDLALVKRLGVRFEVCLGLTGGEDTLFTRRLVALGARIVWCEESEVVDRVPDDRATRAWALRRSMSHGNTTGVLDAFMSDRRHDRLARPAMVVARGLVRVGGGTGRWLAGVALRSLEHQARGARTAARGLGMACGGLGFVYQEYARSRPRWRRVDRSMRAALAQSPTDTR